MPYQPWGKGGRVGGERVLGRGRKGRLTGYIRSKCASWNQSDDDSTGMYDSTLYHRRLN
jgi:hypothetical protein